MDSFANKKWTLRTLSIYIIPSVLSMLFLSLYTTIDGLFIARYVGAEAVAAVNIAFPAFALVYGTAIMFTIGGFALIGIKLGEKKFAEANRMFSQTLLYIVAASLLCTISGLLFPYKIAKILGASDLLVDNAAIYIKILLGFTLFTEVKIFSEFFMRIENHPLLAFWISAFGGIVNVILDYLFIVKFGWGVSGAAYATAAGWFASLILPVLFYLQGKTQLKLRFCKPDLKFLRDISINGSSEMVTEISTGITTFLFNLILLKMLGEIGVAAIAIIMYSSFLFGSVYMGIGFGVQPLISWYFGAAKIEQMRKVTRLTLIIIGGISICFLFVILQFGDNIVSFFAKDNLELISIASPALKIFGLGFIIMGFNIFFSSYFTSINKGKISALISFLRALVFVILGLIFLPKIFGVNGIWLTVPIAESLTIIVSTILMLKHRKKLEIQVSRS
jgi:MATE family, multidrug efflux pump